MNEAKRLESDLHELIPISRAMAIRVERLTEDTLVLAAPLAANHNHAGTGFAGSLYAIASLAGWALLRTVFERRSLSPELVLGEGTMRYLRPATGDLAATARLPADEQSALIERVAAGQRARTELEIPVPDTGTAVYRGRFFARPARG